jgi:adenylate/nucleoside-diphosphate kinase
VEDDPFNNYGWCKTFCPVVLKNQNCLKFGEKSFAVKYENKIYLMSDQQALDKFMATPAYFSIPNSTIPPLRLLIAGPSYSGKSTVSALLNSGVPVVHCSNFISKDLPLDKPLDNPEEMNQMIKEYIESVTKMIKSLSDEPYRSSGFILEGFPRRTEDVDVLQNTNTFLVDKIIFLKADSEILLKRAKKIFEKENNYEIEEADEAILLER